LNEIWFCEDFPINTNYETIEENAEDCEEVILNFELSCVVFWIDRENSKAKELSINMEGLIGSVGRL
jgi:hypothetical protein